MARQLMRDTKMKTRNRACPENMYQQEKEMPRKVDLVVINVSASILLRNNASGEKDGANVKV